MWGFNWAIIVSGFEPSTDGLDSKVHEANMGPIWGQKDPGGPHVCPVNFAFWVLHESIITYRHWPSDIIEEDHHWHK